LEKDIERILSIVERISEYDERVEDVRSVLNAQGDGWVPNELFDVMDVKNREFHKKWRSEENGGPYPFQDGAPSFDT